jgi:hypothetical protein
MSVQSSDKSVVVTYVVIAVLSYVVEILSKPQLVSASSSERIVSHYAFLQHVYTMARQLVLQVHDFSVPSTFCVSTALFNCAISSVWPTVPRKIGLNWFIPAFVKRRVGSLWGTTEEDGTTLCVY